MLGRLETVTEPVLVGVQKAEEDGSGAFFSHLSGAAGHLQIEARPYIQKRKLLKRSDSPVSGTGLGQTKLPVLQKAQPWWGFGVSVRC